ncbi:uncharacterized protein B0I36DRAFT_18008 [Microdochium trichocladiopsis]|uniref:Uncharacterized protein n=1 Tax=Microdochium trichocladiopsis TaxID=1682393 RepID=A0A9P8YFX1_9PEZI|nr:uncharacterized protein B0I36DRAFT_18008 [Microdochium trichocladiopsis]KAH7040997.1 hypothetical protein B0I36DRAFT_18008 [Microdochium trichocladiopsis]
MGTGYALIRRRSISPARVVVLGLGLDFRAKIQFNSQSFIGPVCVSARSVNCTRWRVALQLVIMHSDWLVWQKNRCRSSTITLPYRRPLSDVPARYSRYESTLRKGNRPHAGRGFPARILYDNRFRPPNTRGHLRRCKGEEAASRSPLLTSCWGGLVGRSVSLTLNMTRSHGSADLPRSMLSQIMQSLELGPPSRECNAWWRARVCMIL